MALSSSRTTRHSGTIMTNGMKIARQLIAEEREKQTGFLDLGMLGLTELPEELFELTELRGLNLGLAYYDKCGKRRKPPHFGSSNWLKNIPRNLGRLQGLEALYISHNPVADFSPLLSLGELKTLQCASTALTDLQVVHRLEKLKDLDVSYTSIEDFSLLSSLKELEILKLVGTFIRRLTPIQNIYKLKSFNFSHTPINDLSPIRELNGLRHLNFDNTRIINLDPIQHFSRLERLRCSRTGISAWTTLQNMTGLQVLTGR